MPRNAKGPKVSTSSPLDESVNNSSPGHGMNKKRKPTYLVRKEEEKTLRDGILQLEAQVAVLKTQGMPAGLAIAISTGLQEAKAKSKVLTDTVKQQHLGIAAAQSLMMECMDAVLESLVHLSQDRLDCKETTLLNLREEKLRNAYEYVVSRSREAAGGQDQVSSELFETDNGDICSLGSTVIHFPGVKSLRQVFEALWFYLTDMEISISERLGHITVREDYDMIEGLGFNARIISSDNNGITTESNTVMFAQLFEEGELRFGGEPCAVVAFDCVDKDELYPYKPSEHVRKDISGAKEKGFLKLHRPEFPVAPLAQQELEAGIGDWGKVMTKAMREILYARA